MSYKELVKGYREARKIAYDNITSNQFKYQRAIILLRAIDKKLKQIEGSLGM